MSFKKRGKASIGGNNCDVGPIDADIKVSNDLMDPGKGSIGDKNNLQTPYKLLWFKGKLNGQLFLLDCGASICCIVKRCMAFNNIL